jgi:hypothetical protein
MHDLTLVSCNYNTPEQIQTLLKSWAFHNAEVSKKFLIMEHSTNEDTVPFYVDNGIPFIRNKGSVHYRGVEAALHLVNTRYMLLVDSDVVFHKPLEPIIQFYMDNDINLAGRVEGDRGGFLLHKRIHPWYCFIDLSFIRKYSIRFVDMVRVNATHSEGFYQNMPRNEFHSIKKYDVGATFLEDAMKHGARVFNHNLEGDYFTHYEGMSWRKDSGNQSWIDADSEARRLFSIEYEKYKNVNLNTLQ